MEREATGIRGPCSTRFYAKRPIGKRKRDYKAQKFTTWRPHYAALGKLERRKQGPPFGEHGGGRWRPRTSATRRKRTRDERKKRGIRRKRRGRERERERERDREKKRKKAPDNRPIPPLAENTENRESASLLLSSSFSLPPSPTCADFQEFSVIFGPRTRFNTLSPLSSSLPSLSLSLSLSLCFVSHSSSILSSFISFSVPAQPFWPDSCQKPEDIWSPDFFPPSTRGRKGERGEQEREGGRRGKRRETREAKKESKVDEPSIKSDSLTSRRSTERKKSTGKRRGARRWRRRRRGRSVVARGVMSCNWQRRSGAGEGRENGDGRRGRPPLGWQDSFLPNREGRSNSLKVGRIWREKTQRRGGSLSLSLYISPSPRPLSARIGDRGIDRAGRLFRGLRRRSSAALDRRSTSC